MNKGHDLLLAKKEDNIHNSAFKVFVIDEIPRNEYGKVKFAALEVIANSF